MFGQFQAWKLNTWQDYLSFAGMLLGGAIIFWLLIRYIKSGRTDQAACRRVIKKLRRLAGKNSLVCPAITLATAQGEQRIDCVLVDAHGLVLVRAIGWGTEVYGQLREPTWRVKDYQGTKELENPLLLLEQSIEPIQKKLHQQNLNGVSIHVLAVFADTYEKPTLYLGRNNQAETIQGLKLWYKERAKSKPCAIEFAQLKAFVEALKE